MRIVRLKLLAYGHFTNHLLEFGVQPALHLIYGDNETGKSTALRAVSSILFGYPHELVDAFKHDAKDIAIGADLLAQDGRQLSFVRKRRGRNALANSEGIGIDSSMVSAFLGGASQEVFEKVFALDHHRLHEHARALLAEGGSLGFSLAEAGTGIAGLKTVIEDLKGKRSELFLASGSKPRLNQLIARLIELRKEVRRRTVSPNEYKKLQKQIAEAEGKLHDAREKRKAVQANIERLERIARNLPLRAEHQALSQKIERLKSIPLLPHDMTQQRIKIQTDRAAAAEAVADANTAIQKLESQMKTVIVDEGILSHREEIELLAQQRPVIENANKDLPKREGERNQFYKTIADLFAEAELSGDPANLHDILPSAIKRKAISALAEAGTKLAAKHATSLENAERAADALKKAEEQAAQAPKPPDIGEVARTLAIADKLSDIAGEISKRTRALKRRTEILRETVIGLGINTGDVSALRELAIPPELTMTRYKELAAAADKSIAANLLIVEGLQDDIGQCDRKVAALRIIRHVVTEEDLRLARDRRNDGWDLVRGIYVDHKSGLEELAGAFAPKGSVADQYEIYVTEADQVADTIRGHVAEAAELSLLQQQRAETETKLLEARQEQTRLDKQLASLLEEWRTHWPSIITPQLPAEMVEWLRRRELALAEGEKCDEERDEIEELKTSEHDSIEALVSALAGFTLAATEYGLEKLRDCARRVIDDAAKASTLHAKANEAVRVQAESKVQAGQSAAKIESQITEWDSKWSAALEAAGLNQNLSIESASVILDIMNSLDGLKLQVDGLSHRIDTMQKDRDSFKEAVAALASAIQFSPFPDPIETSRQISLRLEAAKNAEAELNGLRAQIETHVSARDRAQEKLNQNSKALEVLCTQAGCSNSEDIAAIEMQSADKQQALKDRETLEARIRGGGAGLDLDALFSECEGVIRDQVSGEITDQKTAGEEAEARVEQLMSTRATLNAEFDALLAQNQAADLMQEAANVEAEISEAVGSYVDCTIQELLLRQAIDLYRDRNQGPILKRAKDLFALLTDGSYLGVRADIDETGAAILIAEHKSRGSLEIGALSDGTVDPLYLSLRLAVVQEHNANREPLPFIADDLLLNLDNSRASAALRTLAKIAESSQVLFFTHHAHMAELARLAVPGALLVEHRLPSVAEIE